MANSESNVQSFPKWKVALALGGVAAVGIGAAWYYKCKQGEEKKTNDDELSSTTPKITKENTLSQETELQAAQNIKNKGNKFFKGGLYDKAISCYSEAISVCPEEHAVEIATFYQNRAAAYEQLKNYAEVIQDCSKALDYNKKYIKAIHRRARALEHQGNLAESLEDVTAVCILEGFQNQGSLVMADRVLKALGKKRSQVEYKNRSPMLPSNYFVRSYFGSFANDPIMNRSLDEREDTQESSTEVIIEKDQEKVVENGDKENHDGEKVDESEKYRDESPEKDNRSGGVKKPAGPYITARQMVTSQQYGDIVDYCTKEIETENSPFVAEAYLLRGTFYIFLGLGYKAMEDFNTLLELPDLDKRVKSNALIKRGSLKIQEGDQTGSLEDFNAAALVDPENSDIYHHRGQINLLLERVDDALKDFEKSATLNENFAVAHVQKCYTEYRAAMMTRSPSQLKEAMKSFQETIARFPRCGEGFVLYGQAQGDQYDFEAADRYFDKALEVEPDNANVWVHKGTLLLQWKQDFQSAKSMIDKAIEVDDKCEFAYEMLGTLEVQMGDIEKALQHFNKAIKLAKTEIELAHLFSLHDAASAQVKVAEKFGVTLAPGISTA